MFKNLERKEIYIELLLLEYPKYDCKKVIYIMIIYIIIFFVIMNIVLIVQLN